MCASCECDREINNTIQILDTYQLMIHAFSIYHSTNSLLSSYYNIIRSGINNAHYSNNRTPDRTPIRTPIRTPNRNRYSLSVSPGKVYSRLKEGIKNTVSGCRSGAGNVLSAQPIRNGNILSSSDSSRDSLDPIALGTYLSSYRYDKDPHTWNMHILF